MSLVQNVLWVVFLCMSCTVPLAEVNHGWLIFSSGEIVLYPATTEVPGYNNLLGHDRLQGINVSGDYDLLQYYDFTRQVRVYSSDTDKTGYDLFVVPVKYYMAMRFPPIYVGDSISIQTIHHGKTTMLRYCSFGDIDSLAISIADTRSSKKYKASKRPSFHFSWY